MTSTFQRTEPSFRPAQERPSQLAEAPAAPRDGQSAWPWAAAALCAAVFALPSAFAVPQRLAAEAKAHAAVAPAPASASAPGVPRSDDTLVTGSIAAPSTTPVAPPALRLFGVRLAGGDSADLLWTHWSELKARFPGVLDGVGTAVRPLPGQASPQRFELMAGRFRNAAEAASLCGRLRAHDIACAVKDLEEVPAAPPA
ncbi:MAG: hypothetical protein O9972_18740 [Burkholderiales bacterium]|nr:hypothetical protein [Burkholderiales bacterium]